jgi:cell division inhibitor SepF
MTKFKKFFKKFLGFEDDELQDKMNEEFAEETLYSEPEYYKTQKYQTEEVMLFPKAFSDACEIVENLEVGNIVTIDMNDVELDTCKRITDFVLGAIYVLNGDVEKISRKVFRFWTNK